MAFSFSSLVAVILLTGGELGLGADTKSFEHAKITRQICVDST